MTKRLNRRQMLGGALSGAALFVSGVESSAKAKAPSEKLNLACIGVANKGGHNVAQLKSQNIVALCDVDERFLNKSASTYSKASKHRDFRRMLDKHHKEFDAVVVSTADHTHAIATSIALSLGKHVYCEKPLTHTVHEARHVADLAERKKLATQMGTQIHAGRNYRRVVEIVQSGALGKVTEVHTWCNKGWHGGRFSKPQPAPKHLDWDLWLGPAEKRAYSTGVHPANWRRFWDYGAGTFGDMACHIMDLPFWALDLTHPTSVETKGPPVHEVGAPRWSLAHYTFPDGKHHKNLSFYWSDGGMHTDIVKSTKDKGGLPLSRPGLGILFIGEKGMLFADYGSHQLLPQGKFKDFEMPPKSIADSMGHWNEWVHACKTGATTTCNFRYSGRLTETVLLGIVAYRSGKKFNWNGKKLSCSESEAQKFVEKKYRKGFELAS